MKRSKQNERKGPLELVEEAVHLLRQTPLRFMALYYIGSAPFVMGLLYFWSDMTRGALAYERCGALSLAVVILYIWMRCWQAAFCRALHGLKNGGENRLFHPGNLLDQLRWSPWSLLALGVTAFLMIPYAWTYAFHQNLTAQATPAEAAHQPLFSRAREQARLWPFQNHYVMGILTVFRFFVFINVAMAMFLAPFLLKMLLGINTPLTRHYYWAFNTTFLAAATGLTYLCTDPIVKAVYTLRCYYGDSIQTGRDILADLERVKSLRNGGLLLGIAWMLSIGVSAVRADVSTNLAWPTVYAEDRSAQSTIPAGDFDRAVHDTMARPIYAWKMPRDIIPEPPETKKGFLRLFFDGAAKTIKKGMKAIGRTAERFFNWLGRWLRWRHQNVPRHATGAWNPQALRLTAWGLLIFLLIAGGLYLGHLYRRRERLGRSLAMTPLVPVPDVEDETILASQLPEDEWLALAARLAAEGDFRKALRAWFMSGLAFLAHMDLIEIAKFKSNREYCRELNRRGRRCPDALPAFAENVRLFERGWYGLYPVSRRELDAFMANMTRIKSSVQA